MTQQEENEKLAEWAGIECRCAPKYATQLQDCPRHSNNGLPPGYDRDEVAMSLLKILAIKTNQEIMLRITPFGDVTCYPVSKQNQVLMWYPTIAAAIKAGILGILQQESTNQKGDPP